MTTDGPAPLSLSLSLSLHRIVFRAVVLAACGALALGIAAAAGFAADDLRPGWLTVGVAIFVFSPLCSADAEHPPGDRGGAARAGRSVGRDVEEGALTSDAILARPRPSDARCPLCHDAVAGDGVDRVACAACSAPHHAECWAALDRCATCRSTVQDSAPAQAAATVQEPDPFEEAPREVVHVLEPGERLLWTGRPGPQRHAWPRRSRLVSWWLAEAQRRLEDPLRWPSERLHTLPGGLTLWCDDDLAGWTRTLNQVVLPVTAAALTFGMLGHVALGLGLLLVAASSAFIVLAGGVTHPPWVHYAVTDRRLLVVGPTAESLRLGEMSSVSVEHASRPGPQRTVRAWRRPDRSTGPPLRLHDVDDAQRVVRLVRAARARLRR